jgi:hypothetical protein
LAKRKAIGPLLGDGWRKKERFRIRLQHVSQGTGYPNPGNFPMVPPATRNIMAFRNPLIFLYVKTTTFFAKDFRKTADIPSQVFHQNP